MTEYRRVFCIACSNEYFIFSHLVFFYLLHGWQHIAKPGLWFSRVFDLPPQPDADLEKVPYCLVGVTVAPGFEMEDLQTAKYSELI